MFLSFYFFLAVNAFRDLVDLVFNSLEEAGFRLRSAVNGLTSLGKKRFGRNIN